MASKRIVTIYRHILIGTVLLFIVSLILADVFRLKEIQASAPELLLPAGILKESKDYNPLVLYGMKIDPDNPLSFEFIIDEGDTDLSREQLKFSTENLIKYFLAALAVPEEDLWVNLSPYESDRIITEELGTTEIGKEMLAQDYILKQLSASFTHPDTPTGKKYWSKLTPAQGAAGDLSKIWIKPDLAEVTIHEDKVFVVNSHFKVMSEADYMAMRTAGIQPRTGSDSGAEHMEKDENSAAVQTGMALSLIAAIEKEVNHGRYFAGLRQIYNSVVLAKWYKENLKQSILALSYADQKKILGIETSDKQIKEKIYAQYVSSFENGVFDVIKKQNGLKRRFFSGGVVLNNNSIIQRKDINVAENAKGRMGAVRGVYENVTASSAVGRAPMAEPVYREPESAVIESRERSSEFLGAKDKVLQALIDDLGSLDEKAVLTNLRRYTQLFTRFSVDEQKDYLYQIFILLCNQGFNLETFLAALDMLNENIGNVKLALESVVWFKLMVHKIKERRELYVPGPASRVDSAAAGILDAVEFGLDPYSADPEDEASAWPYGNEDNPNDEGAVFDLGDNYDPGTMLFRARPDDSDGAAARPSFTGDDDLSEHTIVGMPIPGIRSSGPVTKEYFLNSVMAIVQGDFDQTLEYDTAMTVSELNENFLDEFLVSLVFALHAIADPDIKTTALNNALFLLISAKDLVLEKEPISDKKINAIDNAIEKIRILAQNNRPSNYLPEQEPDTTGYGMSLADDLIESTANVFSQYYDGKIEPDDFLNEIGLRMQEIKMCLEEPASLKDAELNYFLQSLYNLLYTQQDGNYGPEPQVYEALIEFMRQVIDIIGSLDVNRDFMLNIGTLRNAYIRRYKLVKDAVAGDIIREDREFDEYIDNWVVQAHRGERVRRQQSLDKARQEKKTQAEIRRRQKRSEQIKLAKAAAWLFLSALNARRVSLPAEEQTNHGKVTDEQKQPDKALSNEENIREKISRKLSDLLKENRLKELYVFFYRLYGNAVKVDKMLDRGDMAAAQRQQLAERSSEVLHQRMRDIVSALVTGEPEVFSGNILTSFYAETFTQEELKGMRLTAFLLNDVCDYLGTPGQSKQWSSNNDQLIVDKIVDAIDVLERLVEKMEVKSSSSINDRLDKYRSMEPLTRRFNALKSLKDGTPEELRDFSEVLLDMARESAAAKDFDSIKQLKTELQDRISDRRKVSAELVAAVNNIISGLNEILEKIEEFNKIADVMMQADDDGPEISYSPLRHSPVLMLAEPVEYIYPDTETVLKTSDEPNAPGSVTLMLSLGLKVVTEPYGFDELLRAIDVHFSGLRNAVSKRNNLELISHIDILLFALEKVSPEKIYVLFKDFFDAFDEESLRFFADAADGLPMSQNLNIILAAAWEKLQDIEQTPEVIIISSDYETAESAVDERVLSSSVSYRRTLPGVGGLPHVDTLSMLGMIKIGEFREKDISLNTAEKELILALERLQQDSVISLFELIDSGLMKNAHSNSTEVENLLFNQVFNAVEDKSPRTLALFIIGLNKINKSGIFDTLKADAARKLEEKYEISIPELIIITYQQHVGRWPGSLEDKTEFLKELFSSSRGNSEFSYEIDVTGTLLAKDPGYFATDQLERLAAGFVSEPDAVILKNMEMILRGVLERWGDIVHTQAVKKIETLLRSLTDYTERRSLSDIEPVTLSGALKLHVQGSNDSSKSNSRIPSSRISVLVTKEDGGTFAVPARTVSERQYTGRTGNVPSNAAGVAEVVDALLSDFDDVFGGTISDRDTSSALMNNGGIVLDSQIRTGGDSSGVTLSVRGLEKIDIRGGLRPVILSITAYNG